MSSPQTAPAGKIIPSGSLRLDIALGIGGIPGGRFIEISGPMASGKTTLCQHILAEAQKLNQVCAFIDTDNTLSPSYAERCGVNINRLYVAEPTHAEQALAIAERLVRSEVLGVIVIDSVTTLIPGAELDTPLGRVSGSSSDDLLSKTLRRLSTGIQRSNTTVVLTNKIGRRGSAVYHGLAKNPARMALKLHTSLHLSMQPQKPIEEKGKKIGTRVQVKIVKNILSPCSHPIVLDIMYNHGIEKTGEILDLGIELGIVRQQASSYSFQNLQLGIGRRGVLHKLEKDVRLRAQIELVIRQKMFPHTLG